jgi:hypothetical protein
MFWCWEVQRPDTLDRFRFAALTNAHEDLGELSLLSRHGLEGSGHTRGLAPRPEGTSRKYWNLRACPREPAFRLFGADPHQPP